MIKWSNFGENVTFLLQATGKAENHLCKVSTDNGAAEISLHREMRADFERLRAAAADAGFELAVASGFRSFERQLAIWTGKASGERPLLDQRGELMDPTALSDVDRLWAICRWSALPGASRHHWGTDLDIYDRAAVGPDYQLQLIPDEYQNDGPFARLSDWLEARMARGEAFGFFRPYDRDRGGVAPEPWHLSYAPVAQRYQQVMTPDVLFPLWREVALPLLDQVEAQHERVFRDFIHGVGAPIELR